MITVDPDGTLTVFGLRYTRKPGGVRHRPDDLPWPHSATVMLSERMIGRNRFMMAPTDRLRLVYKGWLGARASIDGELSMVMADLLMDDIDEMLEHPLNRHRVKMFRKDAETLARWLASRSRDPANNKVL